MPRTVLARSLAASVLSLSLALGTALAPAPAMAEIQLPQRSEDQAALALGALVALGVLGAILNDDDDDDDRDRDRARDRRDERERVQVYRQEPDSRRQGDYGAGRDGRVLPADCVRRVDDGRRVLLGECLDRRGYYAGLPGQCRSSVYADGRYLPVYGLRCLRGSGFYVR